MSLGLSRNAPFVSLLRIAVFGHSLLTRFAYGWCVPATVSASPAPALASLDCMFACGSRAHMLISCRVRCVGWGWGVCVCEVCRRSLPLA